MKNKFVWVPYFILVGLIKCIMAQDITIPPVDTVGCLGGLSTFYCRMEKSDIIELVWNIEGDVVDNEIKQLRGVTVNKVKFSNGSEESYLYIKGLPINDGVNIGCAIFASNPPHILAKGAVFTVVKPPAVYNLIATHVTNTSFALLNWNTPFCLPINHTYVITVMESEMGNVSAVYDLSTDENQLLIDTYKCSLYNISVLVTSIEYNSSATSILYRNPTELEKITVDKLEIEFIDDISCYGNLQGTVFGKMCSSVLTVNVFQTYPISDKLLLEDLVTLQTDVYNGTLQFNLIVGPLAYQLKAIIELKVNNTNYNSTSSDDNKQQVTASFPFVTYHVQDLVTTVLSNGVLEVACYFGKNSTAESCQVVVSANMWVYNQTLNRGTDPLIVTLPAGGTQFTITAYDILNGVISETYAAIDQVFLSAINYSINVASSSVIPTPYTSIQNNEILPDFVTSIKASEFLILKMTSLEYFNQEDKPAQAQTTFSPVICIASSVVVTAIVLIIVITVVMVLLTIKCRQIKPNIKKFTMHNEYIEEVQRNPAYSTVQITLNQQPIIEVNNPAYATVQSAKYT